MSGKKRSKRSRPVDEEGLEEKNNSKYADLFMEFRKELDARYDAQERLVKLSRDCTIQSKRVIFTLHQFTGSDESRLKVLSEAEAKIQNDIFPHLRSIALELFGRDSNEFIRSYSPGLQEFIEAISFYQYLKSSRLISFEEMQKYLIFHPKETTDKREEEEKQDRCKDVPEAEEKVVNPGNVASTMQAIHSDLQRPKLIILPLSHSDFLLGLADLTGELMRLCINAVGNGNMALPFSLLPLFRAISCGFHGVRPGVKFLGQKMTVLRTSLRKVENVCYTLKIRGSEMPEHALMNVLTTASNNEPEEV